MAIRKYDKEKNEYWCDNCSNKIEDINLPFCKKCGQKLYWGFELEEQQQKIQNLMAQSNFWFIVLIIGIFLTIFGWICFR
jgi:rRNA maturation endonuclease Nob1|uniref:Uncharacterized protein n=1 Tax=candidate division WOR-3 bacterium TaxID=2052148 RepID=A0A7C6EBV1_UNCW3